MDRLRICPEVKHNLAMDLKRRMKKEGHVDLCRLHNRLDVVDGIQLETHTENKN